MIARTPEEKLVEALSKADNADAVRDLIETALQEYPELANQLAEIAKQATTMAIRPRYVDRANDLSDWIDLALSAEGRTQ